MFTGWIEEVAPSPLIGPVEVVRDRPWSLIAKVPTAAGPLWFKENRVGTRYEAYLLDALGRWAPDHVLAPIAVDTDRGWSLQRDGGPSMRDEDATPDVGRWERLLARHAELQRLLPVRVPDMLGAGVPDHRPDVLMARFDQLAVPAEVVALRPVLVDQCAELATSAVPASLQHDDLHDNNVFASGQVFDWGDSNIGHPFAVLLIALQVAEDRFEVAPGDPLLDRLRDAYLEVWSDLDTRPGLLRTVELASELGKIGRALAWTRAMPTPEESAESVQGWLRRLLPDPAP